LFVTVKDRNRFFGTGQFDPVFFEDEGPAKEALTEEPVDPSAKLELSRFAHPSDVNRGDGLVIIIEDREFPGKPPFRFGSEHLADTSSRESIGGPARRSGRTRTVSIPLYSMPGDGKARRDTRSNMTCRRGDRGWMFCSYGAIVTWFLRS
jgi:hypothetical protein